MSPPNVSKSPVDAPSPSVPASALPVARSTGSFKERPILFSAPMVRAILEGRKTQTRRIVKLPLDTVDVVIDPGGTDVFGPGPYIKARRPDDGGPSMHPRIRCPYGYPGDRLWVREGFAYSVKDPDSSRNDEYTEEQYDIVYRAESEGHGDWTNYDENGKQTRIAAPWRPSIHMPRWASRIDLEVAAVRVERLHAITESDAHREGCSGVHGAVGQMPPGPPLTARAAFEDLWRSINGAESWDANPWVWVVEFRRVQEEP